MNEKPRRLRNSEHSRKLMRETRLSASSLILPLFVREGKGVTEQINSLEGQKRYSVDTIYKGVEEALKAGVSSFMLFGITNQKDDCATGAYDENGVVQQSVKELKKQFGDQIFLITDVCLCEYTSHGHCGIVSNEKINNTKTLPVIAKTALSHAQAGCDMVAPSDMMDGRVAAIRSELDLHGFENIPIMSYAAKYSSAFYGPFREAVGSAPRFGDRKTYQMDYHNSKEALKEVLLDIDEGADIVMVKPALSYLDIIYNVSSKTNVPVAAYSVSGEYAMIKSAARAGLANEYAMMCETAVSIFRAGATMLITYYSMQLAEAIKKGDIG